MTQRANPTIPPIYSASLGKRLLQGAVIALILITIFLLGVKEPKPEWGKLWMLKPLIVVSLGGAVGGGFYFFMDYLRLQKNWNQVLVVVVCLIVYIIGLWIGIVLGLNGTLWN